MKKTVDQSCPKVHGIRLPRATHRKDCKMVCKHISRRNKAVVLLIALLLSTLAGLYYMEESKYRMYVFVTGDDPGDPEWPSKKVWFSAKQWLTGETDYLKVSDHDLINKNGVKMPAADSFIQDLYWTLTHDEYITEQNMPYDLFVREVKPTFIGRYLYSEFDRDTLRPTVHRFLISFRLNGKFYDSELVWETEKHYVATSSIFKPGVYSKLYGDYTYQDYRQGKPLPKL